MEGYLMSIHYHTAAKSIWDNAEKLGNLSNVIIALVTLSAFIVTIVEYFRRKKQYDEENKPYVIVELDRVAPNMLDVVIRNIGKSAAKDIKITFDPNFELQITKVKINDLKILNDLKFLPPNKKISFFFGSYLEQGQYSIRKEFKVKAAYSSLTDKTHTSGFILDPRDFEGISNISRKDIHDVAKTLDDINKNLGKLKDASSRVSESISEDGVKIRSNYSTALNETELLTLISNIFERGIKYELDIKPYLYDLTLLIKLARDSILLHQKLTMTDKKILVELSWLMENHWNIKPDETEDHFKKLVKLSRHKP